jgi:hypothetical protein
VLGVLNDLAHGGIYVGTGYCCHGHVYKLDQIRKDELRTIQILSVDLNVYDLLPVIVDYKKTGFCNEHAGIIVTGYGCAGQGVRLLDTLCPKSIDVISTDDCDEMYGSDFNTEGFACVEGAELIDLVIRRNGGGGSRKKDITNILREAGVDIEKTFEMLKRYKKIK